MSKQKQKFRVMKVFDCQDMPKDIKKLFFEHIESGNDCFVSWYFAEDGCGCPEVDKWLLDNGAAKDEKVLIEHWW